MRRNEKWGVGLWYWTRMMRQKGKLKSIETSQMADYDLPNKFHSCYKVDVGTELCFIESGYISLHSINTLWYPPSKSLLFTIVPYFIPNPELQLSVSVWSSYQYNF
jgi:hypothetical protein